MTNLTVVPDPDDDPDLARPLPHDVRAEQQVLGAMMLSPRAVAQARELLDGGEFYRPAHQVIWQALGALADRGDPCEPTAVAAELGLRQLGKVGGAPYLHTLLAETVSSSQVGYYAHRLIELAYARQVASTGIRLTQLGHQAAEGEAADLRGAVAAAVQDITAADGRGWPEPTPLEASRNLPVFPLDTLPDWLGGYAARLAEQTQTPHDLAGCLALAVLAVAAGGKVWVQARGWREPTNLFTVIALGPGNRKSEVFAAMTGPIRVAEAALREAAQPLISEISIQRRVAEADLEKAEKAAINAIDVIVREQHLGDAQIAAQRLEELQVPPEPRLFSDDATPEVLTSLLAQQGGRMAVLSPEGEIFSIAAGRYSGAPNFAVLKHGHAGEGMRIDRIGRASEIIESAHVTLGVCTQPDVLAGLADTPQFRGQGLLGRILYAVPASLLGYRDHAPALIPVHIAQTYAATLTNLITRLHGLTEPISVNFTEAAIAAVQELLADTEPRFRPGNDLAHMPDWGGKYPGAVVRIAGLLHLAQHHHGTWHQPIGADTFAQARQIGRYFLAHAQAAYDLIGADPELADARALRDWIVRTHTRRFTARDAVQALRPRFRKVADIDPGLRVLEAHGWIRRLPVPPRPSGAGRVPATVYESHPESLAEATP
jgi:replicative DNA helicase